MLHGLMLHASLAGRRSIIKRFGRPCWPWDGTDAQYMQYLSNSHITIDKYRYIISFETGNASLALVPVDLRVLYIVYRTQDARHKTKQGGLQNNKNKAFAWSA